MSKRHTPAVGRFSGGFRAMASRWPRANAVTSFAFFIALLGFTLYRLTELDGGLYVVGLYAVGLAAGSWGFGNGYPPFRRHLRFLRPRLSQRQKSSAIVGALIVAAIVGQLFATGGGPGWVAALVAGGVGGMCCIAAAASIRHLIVDQPGAP